MADSKATKPAIDSVIVGVSLTLFSDDVRVRCTCTTEEAVLDVDTAAVITSRKMAAKAIDVSLLLFNAPESNRSMRTATVALALLLFSAVTHNR